MKCSFMVLCSEDVLSCVTNCSEQWICLLTFNFELWTTVISAIFVSVLRLASSSNYQQSAEQYLKYYFIELIASDSLARLLCVPTLYQYGQS